MGTSIIRNNGTIIFFDTAETVVKTFPSRITSHPIETGAKITDNIVNDPRKISVNAVISDAAFQFKEGDSLTETKAVEFPDERPQFKGLSSFTVRRVPTQGRSQAALGILEEIRDKREIFTLQTRDESFLNMVFTEFSVPRDADTGDAVRIRFTAQQIETVQRSFVTIPQGAVKEGDEDKASDGVDTGKQTSTALENASAAIQLSKFGIRNRNPDADVQEVLDEIFGELSL